MEKHYTYVQKSTGQKLEASEWNNLAQDVDAAVDAINNILQNESGNGSDVSLFLYLNDKGNLCLETTSENAPADKGKLNIESISDIQLKPGDDIMLYGDHRGEGKTDEVSIKVMNGTGLDDVPAKLLLNMSEITLTTKDKTGNDANVLDINVNLAKNTKGYLKVRAQAIDLRCEDHGGIALLPKGEDGQGHQNKIKFEHGGGDGLEFGTFNTEKTSIYTDEYRFKKDGVWKMATRTKVASDKADANDPTTAYKYEKQADDFYDVIDSNDNTCTTRQIINVAKFFSITGSETTTIAGYTLPVYYDIIPITVSDIDDDTDVVNSNWTGPTETGYWISFVNANIYDLIDTMPSGEGNETDLENFIDIINSGSSFKVGIDTSHVYEIKKTTSVTSQDIFRLVSYMKSNNQGPWANNQ